MNNKIATINDFSDDILTRIFSYINFVELQRLEIVCKRWQSIIHRMWTTKRKLLITVESGDSDFLEHKINIIPSGLNCMLQSFSAVKAILKLCAGNITELIIVNDDPEGERPDDTFESLLCNENLKCFSIVDGINGIMEDCLKHLPLKCLQEFSISNDHFNDEFSEELIQLIEEILTKKSGFTSINIGEISSLMLEKIALMTELKKLQLGHRQYDLQTEDLFFNATLLVNLEELEIYDDKLVNDRFLLDLVENCKLLRVFKFTGKSATNIGLKVISELPNLRCVALHHAEGFELLNYFSNLEEFRCRLNYECEVPKDVLLNFFKRSPNLKLCGLQNRSIHNVFDEIEAEVGATVNFSDRF